MRRLLIDFFLKRFGVNIIYLRDWSILVLLNIENKDDIDYFIIYVLIERKSCLFGLIYSCLVWCRNVYILKSKISFCVYVYDFKFMVNIFFFE